MEIIGRERERRVLTGCENSRKPEFIAVYGRRRVGKTYLIVNHFNNNFTFSTTGVFSGNMKDQLNAFHSSLVEYFKIDPSTIPVPKDWFQAFALLREGLERSIRPGRKVLFIDEMPWLDTHKSGFLPALEHFWNAYASRHEEIMLIVCGSAASWIISKLLDNYGGLHNRVTATIVVEPFNLAQSEEFLENRNVVMSRRQIAEAYMILGGIPFYLEQIDKMYGLNQNIDQMFFSKSAKLHNEFNRLYHSLFRNAGNHIRIAEALSKTSGGMTRKELSAVCSISNGGGLTQVLSEMEACGLIAHSPDYRKRKDGDYYCLTDFFTIFYFSFMDKFKGQDPHFWANYTSYPAHAVWCGLAFERLCMAHLQQIKQRLGISGVITEAYTFRSAVKGGAQIDLIIDRRDDVINLCQCRYTADKYALTQEDWQSLMHKRAVFLEETRTKKAIHMTIISAGGLALNPYSNDIQAEITLDDLFTS